MKLNIIFAIIGIFCIAGLCSAENIDQLSSKISGLDETTAEQKRKKAVLELVLERINYCTKAGERQRASELINDAKAALHKDIGHINIPKEGLGYLSELKVVEGNPYLDAMYKWIEEKLAKPDIPWKKATPDFMENWAWSQDKTADELAAYQAYALQILKNAGLTCEGLTTPGGYASRNQDNLALSTLQSVRDVYSAEISHYFRNLYTEKGKSVAPQVLYPSGLDGPDPKCVVSIVGCTGDWFGGWDGLVPGDVDRFITADLQGGRLVDVIESGEPAIMVCHWPGIYFNGQKVGFNILKQILHRLNQTYDHLTWMKLSDIARYWAAKELTSIEASQSRIELKAPFAAPDFTIRIKAVIQKPVKVNDVPLQRVQRLTDLKANSMYTDGSNTLLCFDLKKGHTEVAV